MNQKPYFQAKTYPKTPKQPSNAQKHSLSTTPKHNEPVFILADLPQLAELIHNIEKQVIQSISFHNEVYSSQQMSRCMQHNNVITLYCKNDNKPLCVGCSYLSQTHRNHRVVPLEKAEADVIVDLKESIAENKGIVKLIDEYLAKNDINSKKADERYPQVLAKVNEFYKDLEELIIKKRDKHMDMIHQHWARLKFAHTSTKQELQELKRFTQKQMDKVVIDDREKDLQKNLHRRNVSLVIGKITTFIKPELINQQYTRFDQDIKRFKQIKTTFKKQLIFTQKLQPTAKPTTSIHKTKPPRSITPNHSKTPIYYANESSTTPLSTDKPTASPEKTLIRNRHSKTDLLKRMQRAEKIKQEQEESVRKRKKKMLSNIIIRSKQTGQDLHLGSKQHTPKSIKHKN